MSKAPTLWTKNFTLLNLATVFGAVGGIAGSFALSLLVFDETGSTLASALILAIQVVPAFLLPMLLSTWMDRLPRKPVLVTFDLIGSVMYALAGLYLMKFPFTYIGYLFFSLLIASLNTMDSLAYTSIYPKLIPAGMETKGYAFSGMLYSVLNIVAMPLAAALMETFGVAWILIIQGGLSLIAAFVESRIQLREESRMEGKRFSFRLWWADIKECITYLKDDKGLRAVYTYVGISNSLSSAYSPILVAFFRTTPGLSMVLYAFFSVAECIGRSIGGLLRYIREIRPERRFRFAFFVYNFYDAMDAALLWLPYPIMLVNRCICGFLGAQSATLREAAVQQYIPERMRARLGAFSGMLYTGFVCVFSLLFGALGEVLDYRLCITIGGLISLSCIYLFIGKNRKHVDAIYRTQRGIEDELQAEQQTLSEA